MTTYYLDSASGNDAASGTSQSGRWKTLGKLASVALAPGDTVLFQRGRVWQEPDRWFGHGTGTPGKPVTWDAYGSGAAPRISGASGTNWPVEFQPSGNTGELVIRNLAFSDGKQRCLRIQSLTGFLTLESCEFYGSGDGSAAEAPGTLQLSNCSGGARISNCTFRDTLNDGAYVWNSPHVEFASCTFRGISGTGSDCIQFDGNAPTANRGWHIHDCTFDMAGTSSPKGCVIALRGGGVFEDNVTHGGIYGLSATTDGVICRRNSFNDHNSQSYASGFYIDPMFGNVSGGVVMDNTMTNCTNGIGIWPEGGASVTDTHFAGNVISGSLSWGVYIGTPFDGTYRDFALIGGTTGKFHLESVAPDGTVLLS